MPKQTITARKEELLKMARQMKNDHVDKEVIKRYTGLSDEEI